MPDEWLHQPDKASSEVLARRVGWAELSEPIVNHAIAREVALEAFAKLKGR